jgi:hypothetical protein
MAISVTHTFVSPVADDANPNEVGPDEWNDTHTISGTLPVANGGTASATASDARTALGLAIGTDVQAYDAQLADIAALAVTDSNIIVGNGTNWVAESGATARTSLGLGTGDSPQFTAIELSHASQNTLTASGGVLSIEGVALLTATAADALFLTPAEGNAAYQPLDSDLTSWAGVTRASGFDTFAATPSQANFMSLITDETFVVDADIGSTVQAHDADLDSWAGVTRASGFDTFTATPSWANFQSLVTDEPTFYTVGGTDVAIADGGTGASTAADAFTALKQAASTSATGVVELATQAETQLKTSTSLVPTPSTLVNFSRGMLWGLTLSNNSGDANNDIDISVGVAAADATPYPLMENTTAGLTKRIDASWAVGDGNGGLDGTESVAGTPDTSTWYHVWLIMRSDTGVVDALFSESATSPTMPANYDYKRRIGSVLNNASGNILQFWQNGDIFYPQASTVERSDTADVAWGLITLTGVPTGIMVRPILSGFLDNTSGVSFVRVGDARDTASGNEVPIVRVEGDNQAWTTMIAPFHTDTSARIHYQCEEGTTINASEFSSHGWVDPRGRLF